MTVKAGIIGAGNISVNHLEGYRSIPGVEVTAVCDNDAKKAEEYAKRYGIAHWYTDLDGMLRNEELDVASVTTWNSAHKDCTIKSLRAKVNVLCEKPMAMNTQEALEMLNAAKESGKLLQVGFVRRFGTDADAIKEFIDHGLFGDIYYAKASFLRRSGCPGGWFGDKRFSGGGPLIDLGVHLIDLVRYLGGCPQPVSVYGVTYQNLGINRAKGELQAWAPPEDGGFGYNVEDLASALVKFDNGLTLQIETSYNLNCKSSTTLELFGTKGGASIAPEFHFYTDLAGRFVNVETAAPVEFNFNGAFCSELRGFVAAALGKEPCRACAEDGVTLMRIIDGIYESACTGHEVRIEP